MPEPGARWDQVVPPRHMGCGTYNLAPEYTRAAGLGKSQDWVWGQDRSRLVCTGAHLSQHLAV